MRTRRQFLRAASGLILFFPYVMRSQILTQPGSGAILGAARTGGGGGGGATGPAITGQSLGTLRNDYTGSVGFRFKPNSNITVTDLGRWVVSGNSGSHVISIFGPNSFYTLLTSGTVNTSGATAGDYVYVSITPYALTSGNFYRIESAETSGGDQWYDVDTTLTATADITLDGHSVNGTGGSTGSDSYVPPNFKYHT